MVLIRMSQKSWMNPEFEIGFKGYVPPSIFNPEDGGIIGYNEISCNDVLFGRGGKINQHSGNIKFREIVWRFQTEYCDSATTKIEKAFITAKIVDMIRCETPPGRFLKIHEKPACWVGIGNERARKNWTSTQRRTQWNESKCSTSESNAYEAKRPRQILFAAYRKIKSAYAPLLPKYAVRKGALQLSILNQWSSLVPMSW